MFPRHVYQNLDDTRAHWLWHTSAGLLWRTYIEALGVTSGYNDMWNWGREKAGQLEASKLMLHAPVGEKELEQVLADLAYR